MFKSQTYSPASIESLEGRQLLSTVYPASAIEGTYSGDAFYDGVTRAISIVIKAKSEKLNVPHLGAGTQKLSAAQLRALENATFSFKATIKGIRTAFHGTVSDSGGVLSGSFTDRGPVNINGTFTLTKV